MITMLREGRRKRDETRRRFPGKKKKKGKKDKDAFRRGQPPTTIHHQDTTGEEPGQRTMKRGMGGISVQHPRGKEGRIVKCEN